MLDLIGKRAYNACVMSTKARTIKVLNEKSGKLVNYTLPAGMYLQTEKKSGKQYLEVLLKDGEKTKRQRVKKTLQACEVAASVLKEQATYKKRFEDLLGKEFKLPSPDERAGLEEFRSLQFDLDTEVSLLEIVRFWKEHNVPKIKMTYTELVARYNEQKQIEAKARNRASFNLRNELYANNKTAAIINEIEEDKQICLIDADFAEAVKNHLFAKDYKASSLIKIIRDIKKILNYAVHRGLIPNNPFNALKLSNAVNPPKGVINADLAKQILSFTASRPVYKSLLIPLVLTMFEGIRGAELCRIKFADLFEKDFSVKSQIRLEAIITKTHNERLIHLSEPTISFLTHWAKNNPIFFDKFIVPGDEETSRNSKWRKFRDLLGDNFKDLPKNSFRHTALSCKVILRKDLSAVAWEAGHNVPVLQKNYLRLMSEKEASEYFAIRAGDIFGNTK